MQTLLPEFLALVQQHSPSEPTPLPPSSLRLIDMGCGTGRNTLSLLNQAPENAEIIGLDASRGMLDVARKTVQRALEEEKNTSKKLILEVYNILYSTLTPPTCAFNASGVMSTLVLEHIPVPETFFAAAAALLKPGGYFLVTNMHSDMGAVSQGFVDVATGAKIRPTSYSHTVQDILDAAARAGFDVVGNGGVKERQVHEGMLGALGERANKWIGVAVWFGVCFQKKD